MPTGSVARFDVRRGYGFVIPDDGGEDVFVHQNNINMDGFRFLKPGEEVSYELEVGEKGMKAVDVTLTSERDESESPFRNERQDDYGGGRRDDYGERPRRREYNDRRDNGPRRGGRGGDDRAQQEIERLRRKQERLVSLLVAKGVLEPGELDGIDGGSAADEVETEY